MTEFEKMVVEEVKRVRGRLQSNENLHQFHFQISASGRVHDGDIKIEFAFGEYSPNVYSSSVETGLNEWERRQMWNKRNAGLVLTGPGAVKPADDIPF
jgi:hypothetical protein